MQKEKCTSLPDFNLATLQRFNAEGLCPNDESQSAVARLILTLALIFNDLKDLVWCYSQIEKGLPAPAKTGEYGQTSGMLNHLFNRFFINRLCRNDLRSQWMRG